MTKQPQYPLLHFNIYLQSLVYFFQHYWDTILCFFPDCNCKKDSYDILQKCFLILFSYLIQIVEQIVNKFIILFGKENILNLLFSVVIHNFFNNSFIIFLLHDLLRVRKLFWFVNLFYSLVNQHVCIFYLLFRVVATCLSSVGFFSYVVKVEVPNYCVIEFEPFIIVSVLNKRVIMSTVGISQVYNHSFENITKIIVGHLFLIFSHFCTFLLSEILS